MKSKVYPLLLFMGLVLCGSSSLLAQDVTGIWRGYFISENGSQYKYEVQVEQNTSGRLDGVTYSYLDTSFYGKAVLTGNFSKGSAKALIQEMKTVEVKMSWGSVSCIMTCELALVRSGKEEFLEGTFKSVHEQDSYGRKKGDDCGGGKVYLRRVKTSEFYVEPSLRARIEGKKTSPPVVKKTPAQTTTTQKPTPKTNTPVKKPTTGNLTTTQKPAPKKTEPASEEKQVKKEEVVVKSEPQERIVERPALPTPPPLKDRTNELVKTILVSVPEITVKLFDNGEIDDDTISVYLNKKLVLSRKRLTAAPLTIKVKLNENDPDQELVMVAENMGRIPPNTSLMIVDAGDKRYEVRITSTEQKNALVRFRFVKNSAPLPLP